MSQIIKTVALIGGSGNVGASILAALLASKAFNVTVFSRASTAGTYPPEVNFRKVDYGNEAELTQALRGQDAVVAALGNGTGPVQVQLIEAAAKAGVKRFIPSDFGSDYGNPKQLEIAPMIFNSKKTSNKLLRSKENNGMTWSAVINGAFLDFGLKVGLLKVDIKNHTAVIFDPENPGATTATTIHKVAQAVVSVLLHPEETKNRYVKISSFTLTRAELIAGLEKASGATYTTSSMSTFELERFGHDKLAKGDHSGAIDLLLVALHRNNVGADFALHKNDNKLLELPQENLEEVLRTVVASA